jgi:hypothetical protein
MPDVGPVHTIAAADVDVEVDVVAVENAVARHFGC